MPKKKKTPTRPAPPASDRLPTERQRECIRAIARLTKKLGRPPSYEQIGAELGITKPGAQTLVRYCEERGFVVAQRTIVKLLVTAEGERWL